jgi:hypothetical protein
MALLKARLQPFIDLARCLESFDKAFDLETAVGVQLDILGQFIGLNRLLTFQPDGGLSPILDDTMYRILLKAKISRNNWNGTSTGMYELWSNLFPEFFLLVRDNQDMSMTVYTDMSTPFMLAQLIQHEYVVPKPMGVKFTYIFLQKEDFEVNDNYGVAAAEVYRVYFIDEDTPIMTESEDYHAVAAQDATREYTIEHGGDIVTDTTDYNAVATVTVTREFIMEQEDILTAATDYNGGTNHQKFKEEFTDE